MAFRWQPRRQGSPSPLEEEARVVAVPVAEIFQHQICPNFVVKVLLVVRAAALAETTHRIHRLLVMVLVVRVTPPL